MTPLSVFLYPFSGQVCDYQAELVIQNHTAIHQEKDLVLNPYSQAPYLASFMPQSKKRRAHPLFCAMPAGRVDAIALFLIDGLFTEVENIYI